MATLGPMSNVVQMRHRYPTFSFGERVRKVRRESGMTQAEFAEKLGVGRQAYAAWEVDKNQPPRMVEVAEKLEDLTGVAREWFLGWADNGSPTTPGGVATMGRYLAPVRHLSAVAA